MAKTSQKVRQRRKAKFKTREYNRCKRCGRPRAYYRKFGHETEVMGASFRNTGQILELAGCDLLTISPNLLAELQASEEPLEAKLTVAHANSLTLEKVPCDEKSFR